jgi:hypothetical protein
MTGAELQSNRSPLNLGGSSKGPGITGHAGYHTASSLVVIFGLILALASAVASRSDPFYATASDSQLRPPRAPKLIGLVCPPPTSASSAQSLITAATTVELLV